MADEVFPGFDTSDIEMTEEEAINYELRAPAYDYERERLNINPIGQAIEGDAIEAYRFWVIKCLLTERHKYLAYSDDFGVEIEEIIRTNYPRGIAESEMQRTVTEALEVDERTLSVDNFEFEWSGDALYVDFLVESIYGSDFYRYEFGGDRIGRIRIQTT